MYTPKTRYIRVTHNHLLLNYRKRTLAVVYQNLLFGVDYSTDYINPLFSEIPLASLNLAAGNMSTSKALTIFIWEAAKSFPF